MLDETEIQSKLSHAATLMSNRTPVLLGFYIMLEKRVTSDPSVTMRVGCDNGQPYLEYGDWFVNMMEPSMLGGIIYANCLRIALHHCDTRVKQPEALFRTASDLVVYEYARNVIDTTKADNSAIVAQLFPSIWAYSDMFDRFGFDPVKDLTLEKVFNLLMQVQEESDKEEEQEKPDGDQDNEGEGNSDESQDGEDNGNGAKHEGESGENDEDDGEESGGGGNGDSEDCDGKEGESNGSADSSSSGEQQEGKSDAYMAIQQMFNPENAPDDMKDWGKDSDAADNIRDTASQQFANGSQGGMTGKVPLAIKEANRVHVDAAQVFNMFMASNFGASTRQTWSMPHLVLRRFGTIAPGHVRKKDKPMILFAIDVSGSMLSMNLVEQCFAAVNNFIGDAKLDLCYWDGICSEILHNPKDVFETDVFGGGCTDPQCVIDKVENEHLKYDGIVFLTDCEFDWDPPRDVGKICIVKLGSGAGEIPPWCLWHMGIDDLLKNVA